jgi:uncharacterized membrane-anchored protein YhcB (DUF1043 family)
MCPLFAENQMSADPKEIELRLKELEKQFKHYRNEVEAAFAKMDERLRKLERD